MITLLAEFWPYLAAAGAAIVGVITVYMKGSAAGADKQKAKEAVARGKNLEKIKHAADARPAGGVLDDPNNRDNR